ncbi:hypothetical protein SDC9_112104 [bioreactor metagenome]|uniref:Uncharacterized protein n=1 Tax=bioreactor metagenome TaxID=1076179 RepID=A0A645BKZ6_9ZZZZ
MGVKRDQVCGRRFRKVVPWVGLVRGIHHPLAALRGAHGVAIQLHFTGIHLVKLPCYGAAVRRKAQKCLAAVCGHKVFVSHGAGDFLFFSSFFLGRFVKEKLVVMPGKDAHGTAAKRGLILVLRGHGSSVRKIGPRGNTGINITLAGLQRLHFIHIQRYQ